MFAARATECCILTTRTHVLGRPELTAFSDATAIEMHNFIEPGQCPGGEKRQNPDSAHTSDGQLVSLVEVEHQLFSDGGRARGYELPPVSF